MDNAINATDTSATVSTDNAAGTEGAMNGPAPETAKERHARLAAIETLANLVTALSGLPAEHWDYVKSAVSELRRDAKDTATPAGRKLFGPGIEKGASRVALEFTPASKIVAGMFDVADRQTAKGREGKVTLSLVRVGTSETLELNSRDHAGIVTECFARRANSAK